MMESSVVWDAAACSPLKLNGSFRGTFPLHLQGGEREKERERKSTTSR
jgi:hypothetical protein